MPPKFQTARFHISTGPATLFSRVRFKMNEKKKLHLNSAHFNDRAYERDAPVERLETFDPSTWNLVIAEVRADTGKFVSTAWKVDVNGMIWWVVIGLNDTVKTIYPTNNRKSGTGGDIVTKGNVYDFVDGVNSKLMDESKKSA